MSDLICGPQRKCSLLQSVACAFVISISCLYFTSPCLAEPPTVSYIFPAGGQRGTKVNVRVGGHYLHDKCHFAIVGPGVKGPAEILRTETTWFEGPIIHQPASQRPEDYPKDYAATIEVAADAAVGSRPWRVWTSQGVTTARRFVVGELPETVENEIDGEAIPVAVKMPITINGRIFPREDMDIWTFDAVAGKPITCAVSALSIGSPLEARLELRDPRGQFVAEATSTATADPLLKFNPSVSGAYELRIHDAKFDGLQNYVYRMTVTDAAWVDPISGIQPPTLGKRSRDANENMRELAEVEPNNDRSHAPLVALPTLATGVIDPPGDRDVWSFEAQKGKGVALEVETAKLGSPLQPLLIVRDADGKELTRQDSLKDLNRRDLFATNELVVNFNPPADGKYFAEISERFASRGGNTFTYALRMTPPQPRVTLELPADVVSADRGKPQKLFINVNRQGGFNAPVTVTVEGLPPDVKVADVVVPANKNRADMQIQATENAKVSLHTLKVVGKYEADGQAQTVAAVFPASIDDATKDQLLLAVTMPTPFKFVGEYAIKFAACGSVYRKQYSIERGGYEGPFEVRLADRQGRHLQGVTGPTITVPAGADEFIYPVTLAPWMELGRTSRSVPMLTGEITDEQGVKHKVCYTTNEQNCQLVNIAAPAPLRVLLDRPSIEVKPNGQTTLNVQLRKDKSITSPIRIELVVPPHIRDVRAEPAQVPTGGSAETTLNIAFGPNPGPFNFPLMVRAVCDVEGDPLVSEATFDCVLVP